MSKTRVGFAGGVALELFKLRARNAELEPLARRAKNLQSVIDDLSRENLELRREVYRQKDRRRQPSGPRRRNSGDAGSVRSGSESSDASAG